MKFNVHAGHCPQGKGAYGAVGLLKESVEDRLVKDEVIRLLREEGHTAYDCTCDDNTTAGNCLARIVAKCNQHDVDLDMSIHLNSGKNDYAGDNKTGGTEVWNYDSRTKEISDRICQNISNELGIANRGTKYSKNLYVLNNTKSKALLVECCFVDDKDDYDAWDYKKCAKAIVEGVLNQKISNGGNGEWVNNGYGWWYRFSDGSYYKDEWQFIDGYWYYFDENGYAKENTWFEKYNREYYFDSQCHMTTGWQIIDGLWYYFSPSDSNGYVTGQMETGWEYIDGNWYYLDKDMKTGFINIGYNTFYLARYGIDDGSSGRMLWGWQFIDNNWYYFNDYLDKCIQGGSMFVNHWLPYNGKSYYFKDNGTMACNETVKINNKEYQFNEKGELV